MRKPCSVIAAFGLTAGLVIVPLPAAADVPCVITNYSPRSVVVGLAPKVATFDVSTANCSNQGWNILGGRYDFFVTDDSPQSVFDPYTNAETTPKDVVVEAYNADYNSRSRVFAGSFTLKRNTLWDRFNASPEPARKGTKITVQGRIRVVDWTNNRYVGFANRNVAIEFRTKSGSYRQIRTAKTGAGGILKTTVTASRDGYWRVRYLGNAYAGASTVNGDYVDVR